MALNAAANLAQSYLGDRPTSVTNKPEVAADETMKALAWFGKNDIRVIDAPIPKVTHAKDAIIKVTGSSVCGSDLHLLHGDVVQLKKGDILGHEFIGIVEDVGPDVCSIRKGQRVVGSFNIGCGSCRYCKEKLYTMCDTTNDSAIVEMMYGQKLAGILGYGHFGGVFAGAQAEYVRQPFADVNLLPVPEDVPDEHALYLSDVVCTAFHAVCESGAEEGETIGIWGLGPVGLHVAQWLYLAGVKKIIAVDHVKERMDLAAKMWGVHCIDFLADKDVVARIKEICPGGLDRAIDCAAFRYTKSLTQTFQRAFGMETDSSDILNEEILATRKFGTVALVADYMGTCNGFPIGAVMEKGLRLIGCGQAPVQKYWNKCLEDIRNGKFDPAVIVTHRFPLEEAAEVYRRFDKKEAGIIKVFLQTRFSGPPARGTPPLQSVADV